MFNNRIFFKSIFVAFATLIVTWVVWAAPKYKFAAGFKGGTYYKIAQSINQVNKVQVISTQGSAENIQMVASGKANLGLTQLDILNNSVKVGDKLRSKIKVVLPIYREELHLLSKEKFSSYKSLKGKTISVGPKNSGTAESANIVLIAMRLKGQVKIDYSSTKDGLKKLKQGKVAAVFVVAGSPVEILKKQSGLYMVKFKKRLLRFLTGDFFPYKKTSIKKGTYPWLKKNATTVSVASVLIVPASMPEKQVSALVKKILKQKKRLAKSHAKWNELNTSYAKAFLKKMGDSAHPGAIKALN